MSSSCDATVAMHSSLCKRTLTDGRDALDLETKPKRVRTLSSTIWRGRSYHHAMHSSNRALCLSKRAHVLASRLVTRGLRAAPSHSQQCGFLLARGVVLGSGNGTVRAQWAKSIDCAVVGTVHVALFRTISNCGHRPPEVWR